MKKGGATVEDFDNEDAFLQETLGITRDKSHNLLLDSQIAMLKEVFDKIDKYNEGILRRSEYIMALRTDEKIIDFIDVDAVKKPNSNTVMTLDMVLIEVERDEMYEMM